MLQHQSNTCLLWLYSLCKNIRYNILCNQWANKLYFYIDLTPTFKHSHQALSTSKLFSCQPSLNESWVSSELLELSNYRFLNILEWVCRLWDYEFLNLEVLVTWINQFMNFGNTYFVHKRLDFHLWIISLKVLWVLIEPAYSFSWERSMIEYE